MSLFQSNLRKQIRQLPNILKPVKLTSYFSLLFIRILIRAANEREGRLGVVRAEHRLELRAGDVAVLVHVEDLSDRAGLPMIPKSKASGKN